MPHPRYCEGGGRTACDSRSSLRPVVPTSDRRERRGNRFDSGDQPFRSRTTKPKSPTRRHTIDVDIRSVYATGCVELDFQHLDLRFAKLKSGNADILKSIFAQGAPHSIQERRSIPFARLERLVQAFGDRGNIAAFHELRQRLAHVHDPLSVGDDENGDGDQRGDPKKTALHRPRRHGASTPGPHANQHELQTARDEKKSHGVFEQKRRELREHLASSTYRTVWKEEDRSPTVAALFKFRSL